MSRPNFERLVPAPRTVPLGVRAQLLFGGSLGVTGWLLLAFLSPFGWLFGGNADVLSPLAFAKDAEFVDGRVTGVKETGAKEGKRHVYEVAYEYRPAGHESLTGTSYTTGDAPAVGDSVRVQYQPQKPTLSRIEGGRLTIFGPAAVVSLVFPLIGAVIAGFAFASGRRRLRVVCEGELASAAFVKQEPTNVTINGRPLLAVTFEYKSADGTTHVVSERTTDPGSLRDERREQVLYLPQEPGRATLVDALPTAVAADERGEIVAGAASVLALVPPLLALGINLALGAWRFLR